MTFFERRRRWYSKLLAPISVSLAALAGAAWIGWLASLISLNILMMSIWFGAAAFFVVLNVLKFKGYIFSLVELDLSENRASGAWRKITKLAFGALMASAAIATVLGLILQLVDK